MSMNEVLTETAIEFGRNIRADLDEQAVREAAEIFQRIVEKGLEERGYEWKEPLRSFVLRHVAKIGRRADALAAEGSITAEILREATESTIRRTIAALQRERPDELLYTICMSPPPEG
ncbi:MAG: hypothetical protein ACE5HQ_08390 [Gemmatimonadota bacterium]